MFLPSALTCDFSAEDPTGRLTGFLLSLSVCKEASNPETVEDLLAGKEPMGRETDVHCMVFCLS